MSVVEAIVAKLQAEADKQREEWATLRAEGRLDEASSHYRRYLTLANAVWWAEQEIKKAERDASEDETD